MIRKVVQVATTVSDTNMQSLILLYDDGTVAEMIWNEDGWDKPSILNTKLEGDK